MLDHLVSRDAAGSPRDDELPERATLPELSAAAPGLQAELRERARASGLLMCWVALLVVPTWAVIDRLVLPAQAGSFLAVRLLCDVPIALVTLLLWRTRLGWTRPEWLTCLVFFVVQGEVAWMVTRAEGTPYYLQGYTLAIMGTNKWLQIQLWDIEPRRMSKSMTFVLKPGLWYRMKFRAANEGKKAVLSGKVWPRGEEEPKDWMLTAEDATPQRKGAPGFFGTAREPGSPFFIDNVAVTPNE